MENTEQEKSTSFAGSAITHGLLTGIGLIVLSLLGYLFNMTGVSWFSYLSYVVLLAGIIWGTLQYRNDGSGGFISYGRALGYGTLISVFAALISSIYIFVFYQYVAPDALEQIKAVTAESIIEANPDVTDEQLDMILRFTSPVVMLITGFFALSFIGFIFSLVTSAFIKKNDPGEVGGWKSEVGGQRSEVGSRKS